MDVITQLSQRVQLPKMVKIQQKFDSEHISKEAIPAVVKEQLAREEVGSQIKPGMRIAITSGSRGVANVAIITRAIADFVKEKGAEPFIIPAMGSHGGATAEGQVEVLEGYGVTEESMGCPINATMDTVQISTTPQGHPVYIDKNAHEADGIILCGRIKAHTAFRGPQESGLFKMAVIGLGKQKGAETVHESGFKNMPQMLPMFATELFAHANILCGVGLVENAFDDTCIIEALTVEEIPAREAELLIESKKRMGKLFFEETDVLVIDTIGKNYSGDGMDPNVAGRFAIDGVTGGINAQRVVVLDLSDESHGNGNGIGMADITTKRFVDKMDTEITYPNAITSTVLEQVKIPMFAQTDISAIQVGVRSCNEIDKEHPRIIRIPNTMELKELYISEAMMQEAQKHPNLEIIGAPEYLVFDEQGNLI